MIRAALLVLLVTGAACAHHPKPPPVPPPPAKLRSIARLNADVLVPTITDYHTVPDIQTAAVPGNHCNVFAQHPAAGQVQVACYSGTVLVFNGVFALDPNSALVCSALAPTFNILWVLTPATSPMVNYQIAAFSGTSPSPIKLPPLVSSPGTATAGGTF